MNATLRLVTFFFVLFGVTLPLRAQQPTPPNTFTSDRLEQMAAPIALYPDALVAQILMASTYPLEVVEAWRWVEKNPGLQGQSLQDALKPQDWDPSVKALCGFPTVLKQMNDNLDWTRDLGDAFLAQKTELMDTIQTMRRKALDAGNLKTTEQQQVIQDRETVVIQPANPEVIYVPAYSPAIVYGPSWYYPTWYYPGWYVAPPWGYGFVSFGIGFAWGFGLWGNCNWNNHCCNINCNQFNQFNSCTSFQAVHSTFPTRAGTTATWQHNPEHRAGVNYRTPQIAHEFGAAPGYSRVLSAQARGIEHSPLSSGRGSEFGSRTPVLSGSSESVNRASTATSDRGYSYPSAQRFGAGPAATRTSRDQARGYDRATAPSMNSLSGRASTAPSYRSSPGSFSESPRSSGIWGPRESAVSGVQSPSFDRFASARGAMSRSAGGSFGGGRSFGGGSRGGGSGARGGGGSRGGGHR